MAETAASALLGVILKKLTDEALKKYARSQKIHSELKELQATLRQVEALLSDASDKEITEKSVRLWLNDLQHLAYDIDDVLDDVATEAMRRELNQESGAITNKVRKLIPMEYFTNFSLSHRLSSKLDSLTIKLQQLIKQKADLGLVVKDGRQKDAMRGNETSLLESHVVGRQGEKERLINKLLGGESSQENFSILPIVGMGGVGKTTLARLLYNDERVIDHFELKAWICVSEDFDIVKISDTIFQYVNTKNKEENKEKKDLNKLQMALRDQFKEKRFLLVLDDVWTEKYEEWESLVRPFCHGAPGSKIIMTTRKEQLLKMIGFDHLDHLDNLSDKDALSLLALHALGVDNFDSHPELRAKGERVVKKCGCLPLALKAIGRLLRTKAHEEKWDDVLNSHIWDSKSVGNLSADWKAVFPALMLSFHDLPADLKQLFAYCSLFPKDFLFNKEELVLLWMAEGFLNKSNATKPPECLGVEYFGELLSRSFFQKAPNNERLFVMHDLMNELATFVSEEFYLRFDNDMDTGNEALAKYRHMSFIREKYVTYHKFEAFKRAKSLRTLFAVSVEFDLTRQISYLSNKILVNLVPELKLLRVLCLSNFNISEVPDFIGSLKHLRYLNLSRTNIKELPENVGNLYNLETLMLSSCERLTKLPTSFIKLKRLRYFDIENTPKLTKLPLGIGELRSLRILSKIIIGGDGGLTIAELKGLENLHGKVSIEWLHKVQSLMHARDANLSQKRLTKLELKWVDVFDGSRRCPLEKGVLSELEPNRDGLEKLEIMSYGGTKFSNWVGDPSFHELVNVSIRGCRKCTTLPQFGQLPSLKKLLIQGIGKVKFIGLEFTGSDVLAFRSLEVLRLKDMSCWEGWSTKTEGINAVFPCLQVLHIENCPKLIDVSLQDIPSLKVLQIGRCGEGVLRSMVHAASSIGSLDISWISCLTYEVWRGVIVYLREVEEVRLYNCVEIRYLWESEADASKVLVKLKKLKVYKCNNLVSLGEKEEDEDNLESSLLLSSLRHLYVSDCNRMKGYYFPNRVSIESVSISSSSSLIGSYDPISFEIHYCEKLKEKINNTSMPMLESVHIRSMNWKSMKSIIQLSNFTHLTSLEISDCPSIESFLDLHLSNLTSLEISNCKNLESLPDLSSLTSLKISNCENLESLLDLSNLTSLEISHCKNLKSLPDLSNLTSLEISNCENLESPPALSNLTSLKIRGCEILKSFPDLSNLTSLEIFSCENLESLADLSNLISLEISFCKNLESLADLSNLTSLKIYHCENLKSLPNLSNLTSFSISDCVNLESLPDLSNLTLLQYLKIVNCPSIDTCGIWPPKLRSLEIGGLKKPISEWDAQNLPTSLVNLTLYGGYEPHVNNFHHLSGLLPSSLTTLEIVDFKKLESLSIGLQHLTSLQHLVIKRCPEMKHLPESLSPSLLSLRIYYCPKLKERCNGRGSKSHYWPLISHIPEIIIDYEEY